MLSRHPEEVLVPTGAGSQGLTLACEHYAGDTKKLQKSLANRLAGALSYDITIDFEDGAPVGHEAQAALALVQCLVASLPDWPAALFQRPAVGVRVHPPDHPSFQDDLNLLARALPLELSYLTVPKVGNLASAQEAIARLGQAFAAEKRSPPRVQFFIETHEALRDVFAIAALPAVCHLTFGQMDFTSAHRGAIPADAMYSPGQFEHPLMRRAKLELVAACHAAGKTPVHNPTLSYNSVSETFSDARMAKWFGFARMMSIHPLQIEPILQGFAPTAPDIELAAAILLKAHDASWGPIAHEGKLYDRASYRYFWDVLKSAQAANCALPARAHEIFFNPI